MCVDVLTNSNAGQSNDKRQKIGSDWFRASTTTSLSKEHYVREYLVLTHSLYTVGGGVERGRRGGGREEEEGEGMGGRRGTRRKTYRCMYMCKREYLTLALDSTLKCPGVKVVGGIANGALFILIVSNDIPEK